MKNIIRIVVVAALAVGLYFGYRKITIEKLNNEGVQLIQEEKYQEAVIKLESALEKNPKSATIRKNLAEAYRGLGQDDKAREVFPEGN